MPFNAAETHLLSSAFETNTIATCSDFDAATLENDRFLRDGNATLDTR